MRLIRFAALFVILALFASSLPIYACRPLVVDDCPVTEKSIVSIETGISSVRGSSIDGNANETTSLKYGIFNNADIGIDIPYQFLKQDNSYINGIGDITIKSKINIVDYVKEWAGLSFVLGSKLANGDSEKGLGAGSVDYIVNTIATKALGLGLIHTNLGYTFTDDKTIRNTWQYGCSFDYPLLSDMHLMGELVGNTNPDISADGDFLATQIGINKSISGIVFDVGVSFGFGKASPANVYSLGLTMGI